MVQADLLSNEAGDAAPADCVRLRLTISYDGTAYQGWQVQKIGTGVQEKIVAAILAVFQIPSRVHGSSRTDTGVHALGMVAHFDIPLSRWKMTEYKAVLALNAHLPDDIRVFKVARVKGEFHARFFATGKQYRYFVWNHAAHSPLLRSTTWQFPRTLDLARMRQGAALMLGRRDFRSFAATSGYEIKDTVRTLTRLDVRRQGPLITFIIEGDGFLYKMCRGLVGTLVQIGSGKYEPSIVTEMIEKKDRRSAGMSAPAHGLTLWKVNYRGKVRQRGLPAEDSLAPE